MKAFLASLLAVAAFAEEVVYELVNEESEMLSYNFKYEEGEYTPFENTGEFMSLTTTQVDDEIEFCFTVEAPGADGCDDNYFGVEYTDGPVTSLKSADFNGMLFNIYDDEGWVYGVYHGYHGDYDNELWTIDTEVTSWECDTETTDCVGLFCATRALEVDGLFTLPFAEGTNFRAVYKTTSFQGVVYSGAMSLGLALAATAGAALTLV
jgi:hypothetical protein